MYEDIVKGLLNSDLSSEDIKKILDILFKEKESEYKPKFVPKEVFYPTGSNDPCARCNNNPKNNPHASGVCNCTLGLHTIYYC